MLLYNNKISNFMIWKKNLKRNKIYAGKNSNNTLFYSTTATFRQKVLCSFRERASDPFTLTTNRWVWSQWQIDRHCFWLTLYFVFDGLNSYYIFRLKSWTNVWVQNDRQTAIWTIIRRPNTPAPIPWTRTPNPVRSIPSRVLTQW